MSKKPNVLFIMVDQQRYDCIGFSQEYPVRTPNIDDLAKNGIWFMNAYTNIPLCTPARSALINGRRPETFGTLWNHDLGSAIKPLEPREYSWPRELRKLGYNNAYLGKWHVHPQYNPKAYGYEHYVSLNEYTKFREKKYPERKLNDGIRIDEEEKLTKWHGEIDPIPLEDSRTHWLSRKASEMLEKLSRKADPWHIRIDFSEPHLPYNPNGKFAGMYSPENIPAWGGFAEEFINKPYIQKQQLYNWQVENFEWKDWAKIVAKYYAVISQVDHAIGQILNTLERLKLEEDTIVIFTSDHGDLCGSHRMMDKHFVMYEDVVKVPLILKWSGKIRGNSTCSEFVYNLLDLPPTILELLDMTIPDFFQGRSLVPFLKGEILPDWRQEIVATYHGQQFGLFTQRMYRTHAWKYIWNPTSIDELYDLREDPFELTNEIYNTKHKDRLKEFRRRLFSILLEEGDPFINNNWMRDQLLNSHKL